MLSLSSISVSPFFSGKPVPAAKKPFLAFYNNGYEDYKKNKTIVQDILNLYNEEQLSSSKGQKIDSLSNVQGWIADQSLQFMDFIWNSKQKLDTVLKRFNNKNDTNIPLVRAQELFQRVEKEKKFMEDLADKKIKETAEGFIMDDEVLKECVQSFNQNLKEGTPISFTRAKLLNQRLDDRVKKDEDKEKRAENTQKLINQHKFSMKK